MLDTQRSSHTGEGNASSRFRPQPEEPHLAGAQAGVAVRLLVLIPVCAYVAGLSALMRDCCMDDAYIGFRCVENFAAGHGLVFNPGTCAESVTNVGWLLVLTPLSLLVPVTFAAKVMGALLVLLTAALAGGIALRLGRSPRDYLFALPVPLLVVAHEDFAIFSLSGMETGLLGAGLCAVVLLALDRRRAELTALLCGLLFLVHPESVLVWPLAQVLCNGRHLAAWRRQTRPLVVFVATLALATAVRWSYFGDILPNTFYAKTVEVAGVWERMLRTLTGSNVNVSYPFAGLLAAPFLLGGLAALWKEGRPVAAWLAASLLVGLAFAVYSNPDWTQMGRYFAPYAPLALIVFWRGFVDLSRLLLRTVLSPRFVGTSLVAVTGLFVLTGVLRTFDVLDLTRTRLYPGYVLTGATLVEPSLWMRDALPDDAIIATRRIGAVGYYSGKRIFDYTFGLPEPAVARLIHAHGRQFHNPHDPVLRPLWQQVRPDFLLEDDAVIDMIIADAGGTAQRFEIHGVPYRLRRTFAIGDGVDWVLCERIPELLR